MNDQLQATLRTYTGPDWQSNPAMHQIINGYAHYHVALASISGIFLIVLMALSIVFWLRFRKVPKIGRLNWPFEKKVYFYFSALSIFTSLFLALIVAANVSNAIKPVPGFSDSISSITTSKYNEGLHQAFNNWITSGNNTPPTLVQERIHHRRTFHTTRAAVAITMLALFTALSIRLWTTLIKRRASGEEKWSLKEVVWLSAGAITVTIALLMMIVVMANLQSVIAPIANTLQFG